MILIRRYFWFQMDFRRKIFGEETTVPSAAVSFVSLEGKPFGWGLRSFYEMPLSA
jgi:hypothetical protein